MKRGVKTLVAGCLLAIVGCAVIPIGLALSFLVYNDHADQFVVPGTTQIQADQPGRYYLWNDYQTVYQGTSYNESETIPGGMNISVTDDQGKQLAFISDTTISTTRGSSASNSIGYVEVKQPGKLDVSVSGNLNRRVFSMSQFSFFKVFGLIAGGACISILLFVGGAGIGVWGLIKLLQRPAQNTPHNPDHFDQAPSA